MFILVCSSLFQWGCDILVQQNVTDNAFAPVAITDDVAPAYLEELCMPVENIRVSSSDAVSGLRKLVD